MVAVNRPMSVFFLYHFPGGAVDGEFPSQCASRTWPVRFSHVVGGMPATHLWTLFLSWGPSGPTLHTWQLWGLVERAVVL